VDGAAVVVVHLLPIAFAMLQWLTPVQVWPKQAHVFMTFWPPFDAQLAGDFGPDTKLP
jgi:hypothetical protein